MSFICDNQNVNVVGDNFAVAFTAAGRSNMSIYLSGLNTHVTTLSSAGDTAIREQGDVYRPGGQPDDFVPDPLVP